MAHSLVRSSTLLILLLAIFAGAFSIYAADSKKRPPRLTNTTAFPAQHHDTVVAVARYFSSPQDVFAEIEEQ